MGTHIFIRVAIRVIMLILVGAILFELLSQIFELRNVDFFIVGGAYALMCNYYISVAVKKLDEKWKREGKKTLYSEMKDI